MRRQRPDGEAATQPPSTRRSAATPLLERLGEYIRAQGGHAPLAETARHLGVSTRSLQRHLARAGTTFRTEARRAGAELAEPAGEPAAARLAERLASFWRCTQDVRLCAAARHLGLSTRSLQRYLASCGTTYRAELRRARQEMVRCRLAAEAGSARRLASELGFNSLRAFLRVYPPKEPTRDEAAVRGLPPGGAPCVGPSDALGAGAQAARAPIRLPQFGLRR